MWKDVNSTYRWSIRWIVEETQIGIWRQLWNELLRAEGRDTSSSLFNQTFEILQFSSNIKLPFYRDIMGIFIEIHFPAGKVLLKVLEWSEEWLKTVNWYFQVTSEYKSLNSIEEMKAISQNFIIEFLVGLPFRPLIQNLWCRLVLSPIYNLHRTLDKGCNDCQWLDIASNIHREFYSGYDCWAFHQLCDICQVFHGAQGSSQCPEHLAISFSVSKFELRHNRRLSGTKIIIAIKDDL